MHEEHDELIERAAGTLRGRRMVNPRLVTRILTTVEARPRRWWRAMTWPSTPFSLTATATLAAAGLLLGFMTRQATEAPSRGVAAQPGAQALSVVPVSRSTAEPMPVPVQFTLRAVRASQVALVGDFNGCSPTATLLEPGQEPGTWSVTVPLSAGRHVYAFLVDGRSWMTDPRAQKARDLDFGRENSVLIVQAP